MRIIDYLHSCSSGLPGGHRAMADMSEAWGVVFYSFWMAVSSVLKRRALTTAHPVEACATV